MRHHRDSEGQLQIKESRLHISGFLRTATRDGLVVLFHQLHPELIYLSERIWERIVKTAVFELASEDLDGLVRELADRRILVDSCNADTEELERARASVAQSFDRPEILYLMMAQGCNFACTYCPIPALAKRYGDNLLSFEDAVRGIALWQRHIGDHTDQDSYFLIFYGGEPLLNRGVLEQLLPYIDGELQAGRLPDRLELMLCTNGSLIDERLSKLLARYNVTVAVGIDGPQEHNDRIRVAIDGGSTFSKIERAIKQLVSDGVRVVASTTITPANARRLNEYPAFLRGLGVSQFGFNLMKGRALVRELADIGMSVREYCQSAALGVLRGLEDAADGHYYEYQLEKKLSALKDSLPFSVDCTCYGNQLVVHADGQISNCPFLRADQRHVRELPDTFRIWRTKIVQAWRHRLPIFGDASTMAGIDGLLDGGGCAWGSSEIDGNVTARDEVNALFAKEVANELLWRILPGERADALRRGESTYWGYRRIGHLQSSEHDGFKNH